VILRVAALLLVTVLAAVPMGALAAAPVTWLGGLVLVVGGVGTLTRSNPLVTAGGSLAVMTYALALVLAGPEVDPVSALAFGAALALVLPLVHFAELVQGATVAPAVVAAQVRLWLLVVALGVAAAASLTVGATLLAPALEGARLPVVTGAAALGAALVAAGVVRALLVR
jgi:hypothetical protein